MACAELADIVFYPLYCSSDCSEVQLFLSQSKKKFDGVGIRADLSFSCFL